MSIVIHSYIKYSANNINIIAGGKITKMFNLDSRKHVMKIEIISKYSSVVTCYCTHMQVKNMFLLLDFFSVNQEKYSYGFFCL